MSSLAHATLTYVSDLRAAGVPEKQAQIQAEFITDIIEDNLATKTDLEKVKVELKTDIEKLRNELSLKISETKNEMILWFLGSVVALSAMIIASLKLIH